MTEIINPAELLCPEAFLSPLAIDEAVMRALDEDLGRAGDITADAIVPASQQARLVMRARQPGVIAGLDVARTAF